MKRLIKVLMGLGVVLASSACPPKPAGECGGTACASTERCDRDALRCVADEPPVLTLEAPPVVSTATFTVTGTITDDDGVKSAEWRSGSREWTVIDLQSGGAFSLTVDAPALDAEDIVVSLRARDAIQESSLSRAVKVDRVAPAVALQSPDAGSVHGTSAIAVALVVTDGSGALSELSVNGQVVSNPMSGAVVMTSVDVPASANNTLLSVPVVAADSRGNRAMTSFSFYGDRVAPQVTITSPATTDVIATATVTVTFTAVDPGGVASATCATSTGATSTATSAGGNDWSCDLPVAVDERPETVTVVALDAAGNSTTERLTFAIDRVAPTVTVIEPLPGFIAGQPITVRLGTAGLPDVAYARFGSGPRVTLAGGAASWMGVVPLPMHDFGAETLIIEVPDDYGNTTTVTVMGFTDTVAPQLNITTPTPNQRFNAQSFPSSSDVPVSWVVADADPMAETRSVNGGPTNITSTVIGTQPSDNGVTYTTTVVAGDRAGNTTTRAVSIEVDRVAPSVVTWDPANGVRNAPRSTRITFSEPVTAPSAPLSVTPQTTGTMTGAWDGGMEWVGNLDAFGTQAIQLAVASGIVDGFGNSLPVPASRRVHVGVDRPAQTITVATGVADFSASADSDGVLNIAYVGTNGTLTVLRDTGAGFTAVPTGISRTDLLSVRMNAWNVVNGATLVSSPRLGVVAFALGSRVRWSSVDGVGSMDTPATDQAMVVSRPGLGVPAPAPVGQPSEGTNTPIGLITGTTYTRTPNSTTLPWTSTGFRVSVLQSNSIWLAVSAAMGGALGFEWVRYYCSYDMFSGRFCSSTLYRGGFNATSERPSALSRGGGCAVLSWNSNAGVLVAYQPTPACENGTVCPNNTNYGVATEGGDRRFATWDVPGEDTIVRTTRVSDRIAIDKLPTGTCNVGGFAPLVPATLLTGTVMGGSGPGEHLPVRVGNRPGVLYLVGSQLLLQTF